MNKRTKAWLQSITLPPKRTVHQPATHEAYRPSRERRQGAFIPLTGRPFQRVYRSPWRLLCAYYDHRCLCCGQRKPLTKDHVLPRCYGGVNAIYNLQPLCEACNLAKGNRWWDYRDGRCLLEKRLNEGDYRDWKEEVMSKRPDWCVLSEDRTAKCLRCGETEAIPLPMPVSALIAWADYFERKHRQCKPPEKEATAE